MMDEIEQEPVLSVRDHSGYPARFRANRRSSMGMCFDKRDAERLGAAR